MINLTQICVLAYRKLAMATVINLMGHLTNWLTPLYWHKLLRHVNIERISCILISFPT
jgi:hypothetical protein